jgi:2-polyprenyl-3-methyl-5-hydroxy-6-metoxy-1,4-benzoquinol methylase
MMFPNRPTCPICGGQASWRIPFNPDLGGATALRALREGGYDWRLCRRCGNGYPTQQPDLEELSAIWAASRRDSGCSEDEEKARWAYRRRVSRVVAERSYALFSPQVRSPGRFLDIACGLGETVRVFAAHGWDAEGIDADPTMKPLHEEFGIRSRIGQFETVGLDGRYDVIHIAHAIYFMTDPMSFLARIRERLTPSGNLCVVLANFMSAADPGLPSYAHSFFPTGPSMQYALHLAGFETILRRRIGGSIFIAARPSAQPRAPKVSPALMYARYRSKKLRFALIGRPYIAMRAVGKRLLGRA